LTSPLSIHSLVKFTTEGNMNLVINTIKDFPKKGINFIDMYSLYATQLNPIVEDLIENIFDPDSIDAIVAVGSRGWITGSIIAYELHKPLITARDDGKSPPDWISGEETSNEYSSIKLSIQPMIKKVHKVVVIDDLIATGNTIKSLEDLILSQGIEISQILATIKLKEFTPEFKSNLYYCKEV